MTIFRITLIAVTGSILLAFAPQGWAANADAPGTLIPHNDPVALPGVGRVVLAFVLTAGIAVALVYALRRWLPRFGVRTPLAINLRVLGCASVNSGLRVHVVEVAGRTILIAESKSGVAMTEIENNESQEARPVT